MKILNGKMYFEKQDIVGCKANAIFYLKQPDEEQHNFLYTIDEDETECVINGINALDNTLSWEFVTETAINMHIIDKCYQSVRIYTTSLMSFSEYYAIKAEQRTSYCDKKYNKWLQTQGHSIYYKFLKSLSKYKK